MSYKEIKDIANYNDLLDSGMFFELHPELTGIWNIDKDKILHND